jgi:carbonic anhydrase/acetyltransferase-like protein (isoleucine patch superfamily)
VPPGKVLQSGYLYIGSPAKKTRILSGSEKEFLEYSSAHYVLLKNEYLVRHGVKSFGANVPTPCWVGTR